MMSGFDFTDAGCIDISEVCEGVAGHKLYHDQNGNACIWSSFVISIDGEVCIGVNYSLVAEELRNKGTERVFIAVDNGAILRVVNSGEIDLSPLFGPHGAYVAVTPRELI